MVDRPHSNPARSDSPLTGRASRCLVSWASSAFRSGCMATALPETSREGAAGRSMLLTRNRVLLAASEGWVNLLCAIPTRWFARPSSCLLRAGSALAVLGLATSPLLAESKAMRFRGSASFSALSIDGASVRHSNQGSFELDLDESGKWLLKGDSSGTKGITYCIGFDGTETIAMQYYAGEFPDGDNPGKTQTFTHETAPSTGSIYSGNEFPFDAWAPLRFVWFVLASAGYQNDTNHFGRIPQLCMRPEENPLVYAWRFQSKFHSQWPPVVEGATVFFDINDYPKDPIGLKIPSNESEYQTVESTWKTFREKSSGSVVGKLTASQPQDFDGVLLPTEFVLETTLRGSDIPDAYHRIDSVADRHQMKITHAERIAAVQARPEFIGPVLHLKDYRFRHVDETVAMEFLPYSITDKKWRSTNDAQLKFGAMYNRQRNSRFGNKQNQFFKLFGVGALACIFLYPFVKITFLHRIKK